MIWLLIVLLGSFTYDVFKTIVFLNHKKFNMFSKHVINIYFHIFVITVCSFLVFLYDGGPLNQIAAVISGIAILVSMVKVIKQFEKAVDVIVK